LSRRAAAVRFRNGPLDADNLVVEIISEVALSEKEGAGTNIARLKEELEALRGQIAELEKAEAERSKAEEALHRSLHYYRSLIRHTGDMITVLNPDFTLRWGSPSAGRVTGYGPHDLYGKTLENLIHPDDIEAVTEALREVLDNPGCSRYYEHRFRHADGSYHYHEVIATNLLDDPAVRGIVANSRDITARKLIEEELLARNRELDSFAHTVSHDLRTPLSLIEGYAQLMRAEDATEEEKETYLKNIIAAARRMDELTESLLEYAQAGQPSGEATVVDAGEMIREVVVEHEAAMIEKGVDLHVDEPLPGVRVDSLKLRQVLANLLSNAIKHGGGGPSARIVIGAEENGETVTFHVRDNGPGIDLYLLDEIFIPFKKFGSSSGLGIGLSTVKQAVESWGGKIWVESTSGEGTTFFFTAPAA
jgi:PAS domain S-box-containing protein